MTQGVLIHVRVPASVLHDVDKFAEGRSRAAIVTEALQEHIRRRPEYAIQAGRGILANDPNSPWQTEQVVDDWIHDMRCGWTEA